MIKQKKTVLKIKKPLTKKKKLKVILYLLKTNPQPKLTQITHFSTSANLFYYYFFSQNYLLHQSLKTTLKLNYFYQPSLQVNKNVHASILPAHMSLKKKTSRKFYHQLEVSKYFLHVYPLLGYTKRKKINMTFNILRSYWWYKFYLNAVTQQYTMFNSNWMFIECSQLMAKGFYKKIFNSLYKKNFLRKLYSKKSKFLHWFTKFTVFKDLTIFVSIILRWLFFSPIRKHRRIFVLINNFLKIWYEALYDYKKIRGYCIFFKGKLGRKGSVRKSKYFAKRGEVSYSTKSLRLSYKTFHFGTRTGVVGGGLSLFYTISLTFCFLYIYIYVLTLFFMLTFFITFKITDTFSQISLSTFWQSLVYFKEGWLFKFFILQLAGLPPMFIFFIKFGFLVTSFNVSTIFICFLILLNLIGGMFFYLQILKLSSTQDKKYTLRLVTRNSHLRTRSNTKYTQNKFRFVLFVLLFLFVSWFSGIFFIDFYVIIDNLCA